MKRLIFCVANVFLLFLKSESSVLPSQKAPFYAPKAVYPFQMEEIRLQKNACAILEESRNYIIKEEYDKVLQLFLENGFTDFQKKLSQIFFDNIPSEKIIIILIDTFLCALDKTNYSSSVLLILRQINFINAADIITYYPEYIPAHMAIGWGMLLARTLDKLNPNPLNKKSYFEQLLITYKDGKFINKDYTLNWDFLNLLPFEWQKYFISLVMGALNGTHKFWQTLEIAQQIGIIDSTTRVINPKVYAYFQSEIDAAASEIKKIEIQKKAAAKLDARLYESRLLIESILNGKD